MVAPVNVHGHGHSFVKVSPVIRVIVSGVTVAIVTLLLLLEVQEIVITIPAKKPCEIQLELASVIVAGVQEVKVNLLPEAVYCLRTVKGR